jgi:hypothetical protein
MRPTYECAAALTSNNRSGAGTSARSRFLQGSNARRSAMAAIRKTYFLAPSWELTPDELKLGSVVANFRNPRRCLSHPDLPAQIDTPIIVSTKQPSSGVMRKSQKWIVGLFATFLQFIPFGVRLSFTSSSVVEIEYSCDDVETRRFTPPPSYIAAAAEDKAVKGYLDMGGLGAKVFLITGLKIASDIKITTIEEMNKETTAAIGVDMPQVSVGPKLSYAPTTYIKHTRTISGPIVFALQFEKIHRSWSGQISNKEQVSGAMMGGVERSSSNLVTAEGGQGLDKDEMKDYNVTVEAGLDDETGKECDIIVP